MEERTVIARDLKVGDELWWASGWRRITEKKPDTFMVGLTLQDVEGKVSIGNDETRRVKRASEKKANSLLDWLRAHADHRELTVAEVGAYVRYFRALDTAILAGDFPEAWGPGAEAAQTRASELQSEVDRLLLLNGNQYDKIRNLDDQLRRVQKRYSDSLENGARLLREKETLRTSLDGALRSNAVLRDQGRFRAEIENVVGHVAAIAEQVDMVQEDIEAALGRSKEQE